MKKYKLGGISGFVERNYKKPKKIKNLTAWAIVDAGNNIVRDLKRNYKQYTVYPTKQDALEQLISNFCEVKKVIIKEV